MKFYIALFVVLFANCLAKNLPEALIYGSITELEASIEQQLINSRADVCNKRIFLYNANGRVPLQYLATSASEETRQNPCAVVCRFDPTYESVIDRNARLDEVNTFAALEQKSFYTTEEYNNLAKAVLSLPEGTVCGVDNVCDVSGQCVPQSVAEEEPKAEPEVTVSNEISAPKLVNYENLLKCTEEGFFRNPYDCNRFYRCYYNDDTERSAKAIRLANFVCQPGMIFDTVEHVCVLPEMAAEVCNNQVLSQIPISAPHYQNMLKCSREGYFRNPFDCNLFYRCYYNDNSERIAGDIRMANFKCSSGLVFDNKEQVCVLPEHSSATCQNKVVPQEPVSPPQYENMLKCTAEGYFRNPFDCNRFYRCYYNDQSERSAGLIRLANFKCQEGMVFDNRERVCVLPEASAESCSNQVVPQEPVAPPQYENMMECTNEGYFRNPYDCNSFYRCYYNDQSERNAGEIRMATWKCQEGMVFDSKEQVCVLPQNTAETCQNKVVTQEPVSPPQYENMLKCTHEGYFRNSFDCNRFYRCYSNDASERSAGIIRLANFKCQDGMVFDARERVCVLPGSSMDACHNQVVTQEPISPPYYQNMYKCVQEGYFRNPYDCNRFFRCYYNDQTERNSGAIRMANFRCQEGMVFDNKEQVCVLPENTAETCASKVITQEPVSPPQYQNMLKCTAEGYFRNPYDCNRFFRCYFNDQTERNAGQIRMANFKCQQGMVFDNKESVCVLPESSSQTCANEEVTQEPVSPPDYENMLKCTTEGYFRNPYDCNKFFRCYYNDQSERSAGLIRMANFQCQEGLVFDMKEQVCVRPETSSQSCSNQPITQKPVEPPNYENMMKCTVEGYFRNPYDCHSFFRCYFNDQSERNAGQIRMATFRCADDLVFDNKERVCVRPEDSGETCKNQIITQEPVSPPQYNNMLKCTAEGYFRNPFDCNRFYRCYYNDQSERSAGLIRLANFKCQQNLVFDPIERVCVLPEASIESCENQPITQEPVSPPNYENMLKCSVEGYFRNPYDCNKFFRCYYNDQTERSTGLIRMANFKCQEGMAFDNKEQVCVLAENSAEKCANKEITQQPVSPPQYDNMLSCQNEGYFRDPYDCHSFIRCYYNDQTERNAGEIRTANFRCAANLVFDNKERVCVYPETSSEKCSNEVITQEPIAPPQYQNMIKCTQEGYFRNPFDCSSFYRCYYNDQSERNAGTIRMASWRCQEGLVFDTKAHVCVRPEASAESCQNQPITQRPVDPPQYENMLKCTLEGYFRNPYDCNSFFRCYYNDESERNAGAIRMANFKCQTDMLFDNAESVCVLPEMTAESCNNEVVNQEPVSQPNYDNLLECAHEGYHRNPYDCNRFYRCYYNDASERSTGVAMRHAHFKCYPGLVFDPLVHVCVLPQDSAQVCNNMKL